MPEVVIATGNGLPGTGLPLFYEAGDLARGSLDVSRTKHARGRGTRYRNHAIWFAKYVEHDGHRAERELVPVRTLAQDGYYEFLDTAVELREPGAPWCTSIMWLDYSSADSVALHEEDARQKTIGRVRGRRRSQERRDRELEREVDEVVRLMMGEEWMRANGYAI